MRPRNIIPRESVYTQRADYLGVTNSLSWEELWWWKGRTNGEGFRGENTRIFSVVAVSPAILVPFFFFPPFLLFSLPQAFTIEKATRRRAKRRWTIENRNFVFARKNKTPLLVCRSGDHRCFSKRSKNLRASGENSRFSLGSSTSYATTIFTDSGEKERERERRSTRFKGEVSFSQTSLSLSFCGRTGSILKSDSRRKGKKKKKRNWRRGKKT